jgi:hypothetical protein
VRSPRKPDLFTGEIGPLGCAPSIYNDPF